MAVPTQNAHGPSATRHTEADMVWAVLALLGVPLWLCAAGILALVFRNRALRKRHGDIPVRVLRPGHTRWTRGHAVWISDVFAWRGSPAAWNEALVPAVGVRERPARDSELKKLHRLGDEPALVVLSTADGEAITVAAAARARAALLGPFAADHTTGAGSPIVPVPTAPRDHDGTGPP
jgi:hypothetical protein